MAKFCTSCHQIYKSNFPLKDKEYTFCPKNECYGEVVEIDDLIFPIILELNKKGYRTEYCCSGHYYEKRTNTYILFCDGIKLPKIPYGYELEQDVKDSRICIRKYYDDCTVEDIYKGMIELLEWAKDLKRLNKN